MANVSTLKLYNTKINRKRNMVVESIEDYLNTCVSKTINDFQIIKHDKEIDIKVNISSPNTYENFGFNYILILNNYDSNVLLSFRHYYFIDKIDYISSATIKLHLILDVLNTFYSANLLALDSRTLTFREHKDRYTTINNKIVKIIDRVNEDVNPILETNGIINAVRRDDASNVKWDIKWYLVIQKNPDIKIAYISFIPEVDIAMPLDTGGGTIEDIIIGGIDRFQLNQSETNKVIELPYCPIDLYYVDTRVVQHSGQGLPTGEYMYFKSDNITYTLGVFYSSSSDGTTYILNTIGYKKAFYESHNAIDLLLKDININSYSLDTLLSLPNNPTTINHNMIYETKLENSNFKYMKFVYDSDSYIIKKEDNIYNDSSSVDIKFTPAPYDSIGMFKFTFNNTTSIKREADYNVLIYKRKNELPLFNDEYLNYMRSGYNYDLKARNLSLVSGILGSVAGGARSIAKGRGAGGVASVGFSLYQQGFSFVSNDEQIMQNRQKALMQAVNVSGSDDLALFHNYSPNAKLGYMIYDLKPYDKNNLYNIFRLTGYATNEFKIPNTQNRRCYNYISCDAWFVDENDSRLINYIDDIKELYREGITIFHKITNQNKMYDFEQELENWEVSLVAR